MLDSVHINPGALTRNVLFEKDKHIPIATWDCQPKHYLTLQKDHNLTLITTLIRVATILRLSTEYIPIIVPYFISDLIYNHPDYNTVTQTLYRFRIIFSNNSSRGEIKIGKEKIKILNYI
jgi:hypothetical protein